MAEVNRIKKGAPIVNIAGKTFGRIFVERYAESRNGYAHWLCICACGNQKIISGSNLRQGHIKSCGCLARQSIAKRNKENTIHGMRNTSEYKAWRSMKLRCLVPTDQHYPDYGGRGIAVCAGMISDFTVFLKCVGKKPSAGLSLDRKDNEKGYDCGACDDCRSRAASCNIWWADKYQQAKNRRGVRKITAFGKTMCLAEWSREKGLSVATIAERLKRHWNNEDAVSVSAADGPRFRYSSKKT